MNESKLFQRNFTMVVIGQIISLFGNQILRYALPLYLLNQTHSPRLFGIVTACSFVPMLLLAPIGGIVADRVNKRNVMVVLDFLTAGITLSFSIAFHSINLIYLIIVVLMLLYGIQGAYQPTVQASIPLLVSKENLMQGNAIINLVSSLAGLIGPVIGGIVFAFYGLTVILYLSIICFVISAGMELFIQIPYTPLEKKEGILLTAKTDMKESFQFIVRKKPILGKVSLLLAAINLVFSALIIIGVPIIVNEHLGFSQEVGNRLYGYAQGGLAAGGLIGGIIASVMGKRLRIQRSYVMLGLCSFSLLPMGLSLFFKVPGIVSYLILVISCFSMMLFSTIFTIEMMVYMQKITPSYLLGKVIALVTALVMSANPIGQIIYGSLFETVSNAIYEIFFLAFLICCFLTLIGRKVIKKIPNTI